MFYLYQNVLNEYIIINKIEKIDKKKYNLNTIWRKYGNRKRI